MTTSRKLSAGLLSASLFSLVPCTIQALSKKKNQPDKPNIVLFLVDDMGWQDTSLPFWEKKTEFNKRYNTPNMERLAKEGMKFTQAYACAICSPTRVSLMTGMNAARHRVTNWTLLKNKMPINSANKKLSVPPWNMNGISMDKGLENSVYVPQPLPFVLQQNGYKTIHCGKAHFAAKGTAGENPINIGFDVNIAGHAAGAPGSYEGKFNFQSRFREKKPSIWDVPGLEEFQGKDIFLTEALTQKALTTLDSVRRENKPFFLYMAHYAVHTPIMGDSRFVQKYLDKGIDSTEAKYASMIEGMDKSLGDIMDYLKENNIDKNTVIIFMSDNGGLSAHGRGGKKHTHNYPLSSGKGSTYEGGIREPMIVKWNGVIKPNSQCSTPVIIEDFYPTILEIAKTKKQIQESQIIDGISIVSLLKQKNEKEKNNRALFWHYPNNWGLEGPGINFYSTIRKGSWKLIYYHRTKRFELFNINDDIEEKHNLISTQSSIAKKLAKELGDYLKSVDAQMPINNRTKQLVPYPNEVDVK